MAFPEFRAVAPIHIAAWIVVSLLAESLWLSTVTGQAMESMASTVDMSLVVLLGYHPSIWIVAIALRDRQRGLLAPALVQGAFNAGQNAVALARRGASSIRPLGGMPLAGGARIPRFGPGLHPSRGSRPSSPTSS